MKRRVLLAQFENLLAAADAIEDHDDLGQNAAAKINHIKERVLNLKSNIKKLRKKVKGSDKAKPRK